MKKEDIKDLIQLLEKSSLNKLRVKDNDFEVLLEKMPSSFVQPAAIEQPAITSQQIEKVAPTSQSEENNDGSYVTSPMVGTYYSSPAPDKPAFIKVGDVVTEDTVVCIIEAMKVLNEVKAGVSGTVKEILCKNAQPIEYGTKLFKVE